MEAITIAGLAVLAVGGYYSVVDLIHDLGFSGKRPVMGAQKSLVSHRYVVAPQAGIKKMAGMHI